MKQSANNAASMFNYNIFFQKNQYNLVKNDKEYIRKFLFS